MGQYHTLEVELDHPVWIEKECWDLIYLERLNEAADPAKKAELAVIVMQEGLANVCLVTQAMTLTKAKIEKTIPKKKQGNTAHTKAIEKFLEDIYEAVMRCIDFEVVKVVLVGSPGFLNDDFLRYAFQTAERREHSVLLKNRSKFVRSHCSSGYKSAVEELLGNTELRGQLADVRAAGEVRALEGFYAALATDQDRACYGYKQVLYADSQIAVQDLLVTDKLFKAADVTLRRQYVNLVESVKSHGGQVFVFSSMHVSGQQLDQYTGVAATLRFPLPEEDLGDENITENIGDL